MLYVTEAIIPKRLLFKMVLSAFYLMQTVVPLRLSVQEKARFFYQMRTLLDSGLSLQQSLSLAGVDGSASFRRYLQQLSLVVGSGQDLATAISFNGGYFDRWTISLIRLAEYSGSLAEICFKMAIASETQIRHKRLYRSVLFSTMAMVWSLLILTAVIFNRTPMGFIRPEFWLRSLLIALLLMLIAFLASGYFSRGSFFVRKLPIVGKIAETRSLLYFAQLELPLSCGVSILAAVELLREHIPDVVMKANLSSAARQIRAGKTLSRSLQGKLPPIALQMLHTGEETGNLDTAMQNISQYYDNNLEQRLRSLANSLRVLGILASALLVGAVAIRGIRLLLNSLPG
ncbi:MAG: type II secretion system F family protein [Coleofasciculaceae cyanobacterium]